MERTLFMPSRKWISLVLVISVGCLTAGVCAQTTTQPAQPTGVEELQSAAKPADQAASQAAETQPVSKNKPTGGRGPFDNLLLPVMLGVLLLLLLWSSRSRKKQETKRKQMLASLKKGDKVTSIGGIVGTIIEMRDDEIVVKVDETNNVRLRFARWAIRGTGDEAKIESPEGRK
jgi:preprotein translocase subunit YajC